MQNRVAKRALWTSLFLIASMCTALHADASISGIQGQAVVSPNVQLDGTIIGGTPVQTHVTVLNSRGRFVTSFVTRVDGAFRVRLHPGHYVLVPDSPANPYWQPIQTAVSVRGREFATVTIGYYIPPQ